MARARRAIVRRVAVGIMSLAGLAPAYGTEAPAKQPTPPNFVFILADDLGWRDLTCCGSTFYETPNLDRLASQGMRFTQAYSACPVCSPTRSAILTGLYPARTGVTDYIGSAANGRLLSAPYTKYLSHDLTTLPELLGKAGYVSWHVGKWHLGVEEYWPEHHGFAANVGGSGAGHPASYFSPYKNLNLPDGPKGEYLTDRMTDEAIRLIRQRDPSKPFYLNLWHYAPHTPIQAPEALVEKYKAKAAKLGLDKQEAIFPGEPHPSLRQKDRPILRRRVQSDPEYAAMIENLDANVGRLLQAIDELKLRDNTVIVFTSDNGGLSSAGGQPTANLPLREGKGWLYEAGIRVPLIVRWPGAVRPGSTSDVPVVSPDWFATALEAAGVPVPVGTDGVSVRPILDGTAKAVSRNAIFWHYPHYGNQGGTPGSAVRAGDWKLIEFFEDGRLELYNLKDDPTESKNVAGAHPDLAKRLHGQLTEWRKSVDAKIPQPNPDYKPAAAAAR